LIQINARSGLAPIISDDQLTPQTSSADVVWRELTPKESLDATT
jgi:hypothetical protein